jgi:hypothetical protein
MRVMKNLRTYLVVLCALALASPAAVSGAAARAAAQAAASPASEIQARAPAIVFIIRHAEKPLDDKSGDLSPQGFKRAGVLPYLFLPLPGSTAPPRLPKPDALFASDASGKSNRPMETIMPLAQALHLTISHDYVDRETAGVAKQVMSGKYAGKVVLICWHHGEIPHLAKAFGVEDAPKVWNDTVFDQIWKIQWVDGRAHMTTLPEALLKGDSTQ